MCLPVGHVRHLKSQNQIRHRHPVFHSTLTFIQRFLSHRLPQTQFLKDTVPLEGIWNVDMKCLELVVHLGSDRA